ncbi:MAG: metal-dependent transcriptional regulator [Anaerolineae bacterium]|nr:metal-dependent transcriptional regulator [Anaerolineae bacterium]
MEDYLKAIYKLREQHQQVSTSALAVYLRIAPASVTNMCKKLAELNLLTYEPYQGVTFTPTGEKLALEIVRHHRLIELYLAEALGVPWDRVHDEAEKLEHVISEDLEERMATVLGNPKFDPHGAPIPSRSGVMIQPESGRLVDMKEGDRLVIVEVDDDDPELLRHLGEKGLYPGTEIELLTQAPFEGSLTLDMHGTQQDVSYQVAKTILVALQER